MSWHVRDCGVRAVAAVTGSTIERVALDFKEQFGSIEVNGKQMRQYMTGLGWRWHNAPLPAHLLRGMLCIYGEQYIVVTRRGFYAVVNCMDINPIDAPHCGFYSRD